MFCSKCGKKLNANSKFCLECGTHFNGKKIKNSDIIKCGNCNYIGVGDPSRRSISKILACICILLCPIITLLYFLATDKYRCPSCGSNFIGFKNKQGVYVSSQKRRIFLFVVAAVVLLAIFIGIFVTLATVALNSARSKARDAKRVSDIKQIQTAIELYNNDESGYPGMIVPGQPLVGSSGGVTYMARIPSNDEPSGDCPAISTYEYVPSKKDDFGKFQSYSLKYCLENDTGSVTAGSHIASPFGLQTDGKNEELVTDSQQSQNKTPESVDEKIDDVVKEMVSELNKTTKFPEKIDDTTSLIEVVSSRNIIRYQYSVSGTENFDENSAKNQISEGLCKSEEWKNLLNKGVVAEYVYIFEQGEKAHIVSVDKTDCK